MQENVYLGVLKSLHEKKISPAARWFRSQCPPPDFTVPKNRGQFVCSEKIGDSDFGMKKALRDTSKWQNLGGFYAGKCLSRSVKELT